MIDAFVCIFCWDGYLLIHNASILAKLSTDHFLYINESLRHSPWLGIVARLLCDGRENRECVPCVCACVSLCTDLCVLRPRRLKRLRVLHSHRLPVPCIVDRRYVALPHVFRRHCTQWKTLLPVHQTFRNRLGSRDSITWFKRDCWHMPLNHTETRCWERCWKRYRIVTLLKRMAIAFLTLCTDLFCMFRCCRCFPFSFVFCCGFLPFFQFLLKL